LDEQMKREWKHFEEVLEEEVAQMEDYCNRFERNTNVESFTALYEALNRSLDDLLIEADADTDPVIFC
jgi:hypothetical protein